MKSKMVFGKLSKNAGVEYTVLHAMDAFGNIPILRNIGVFQKC